MFLINKRYSKFTASTGIKMHDDIQTRKKKGNYNFRILGGKRHSRAVYLPRASKSSFEQVIHNTFAPAIYFVKLDHLPGRRAGGENTFTH